jgi:hypothetical protein
MMAVPSCTSPICLVSTTRVVSFGWVVLDNFYTWNDENVLEPCCRSNLVTSSGIECALNELIIKQTKWWVASPDA